ncbi:MAG: beta-galactosidase, partial [Saprospiraceae bacterium]|nr:beta-galactosidase [Saprospiraceae bacterium]
MKKIVTAHFLCAFLFLVFRPNIHAQAPKWENPEWEDPAIFQINREDPTASFYRFASVEVALQNESWENSTFYQSLNGEWDFKYVPSVPDRPASFFRTDFTASDWSKIPVPSNWELHGHGIPI